MKLTGHQIATLTRLAAAVSGGELTPGGYSTAGRDASRWWRTMRILAEHKLVDWELGTNFVTITDFGRKVATIKTENAAERRMAADRLGTPYLTND